MEISYRREMKHNYLVIEGELPENSYEVRMMANNVIEGLMKFRVKRVDDKCCYCYEITSKQPLDRLLEGRGLRAEEVRQLVLGMARTLNKMEEYLLKEDQILLRPESIYVDPDTFSAELCLIPGRCEAFPGEFTKLLEYLLGRVDYQDKACVVMVYGMYRESLKENYGMEDMLKILASAVPEPEKRRDEKERDEKDHAEEDKTEDENHRFRPEEYKAEKKSTWRERLRLLLDGLWKKKEKQETADGKRHGKEPEVLPWQMVFEEEPEEVKGRETPGERQSRAYQIGEHQEPEGMNTVLLAEREEKHVRRLVSLEEGIGDICIAYYPFIIGKQENLVDYVLDYDTVSRLHIRIDEIEGICRITDLNSTNGTKVAGKALENNESAEVRNGDEVTVAGIRYRLV